MPLFALALGTVSTICAGYAAERRQRFRVTRRNVELEEAVRERTVELRKTQLEVIHRLAHATESRDQETGMHLERISRMCERVGLALGMTATEAETLRNASLLHDVGKIGVPDAILLQPGRARRTPTASRCACHTTVGAELLSGASSDVMRMAEEIARTHHERWDGERLPGRPGRRGDPARGADLRGVRRLRRAALRSALQGAVAARRGAGPAAPRPRRALRSRGGRRLPADRRLARSRAADARS